MKRREFIKNLGMVTGAGIASFSIAGVPVKAFAKPFMNINSANGKILVIIQFKGGNDGLNTVIPIDQYSTYISNRPTIGIQQSNVVSLTTATGLHPSLKPLQAMFNNGNLAIVQNVGYPNQNLSHFRSTDIWLSASDADKPSYDGWIGRYLPKVYPSYPNTPPTDPMAIQIGSVESLLLENQTYGGLGIAFQNPNLFYQMVQGVSVDNDPPPATLAGDELKFLKEVAAQSVQYAATIRNAANAGNSKTNYSAGNSFGQQMQIVANLIFGGLDTPVYLVTLDGFDTHVNEEDATRHPQLFSDFANSVSAFLSDIQSRGYGDKVVLMTFSEFGRRVKENVSKGTDHGSASPLFVIGNNVQGGIIGPNADLKNLDANGNLIFKIDFRSVYSTMLVQQFGMTASQASDILGNNFATIPLLKNSATGIDLTSEIPGEFVLKQNYPNPFNPSTKIQYSVPSPQQIKLNIYDTTGRKVATLVDSYQSAGSFTVNFDGSRLASGTYFYALESDKERIVKKMVLVK